MKKIISSPIQLNERTIIIDVLRGFALAGVVIANLAGFISFALPDEQVKLMTNTKADKVAENFLVLFIENKFITIFSLLFGYGFGVIIERLAAKKIPVNTFFVKRMLFLLLFGLIHLCFWWGEILNVYASCGLLLLLFRKVSNKQLLVWACLFMFIGAPLVQALKLYLLPANPPERDQLLAAYLKSMQGKNILAIFRSNYQSLWYIFFERWSQYRDIFEVLAKFLLGYFILRTGILKNIAAQIPLIKKVWKVSLCFSLIYLAEVIITDILGHVPAGKLFKVAVFTFSRLGILSLSVFYCSSIILMYNNHKSGKLFDAFRWVGMMSLTNYLLQTVFFVFFFYGLGFGMIGTVHMQWVIPIGLTIYMVQAVFSKYWMRHFSYGPFEWVWRSLSYGNFQPLRKKKPDSHTLLHQL